MIYGSILRDLRIQSGLTLEQYAERIGYDRGSWYKLEAEKQNITVYHVQDALTLAGLGWEDWARLVEEKRREVAA